MKTAGDFSPADAIEVSDGSGMGLSESVVISSKLRLLVGGGILVNNVLLGRAVNHSLGDLNSRRFLLDGVGFHEFSDRSLDFRSICPVSPVSLDRLPHRFLCV